MHQVSMIDWTGRQAIAQQRVARMLTNGKMELLSNSSKTPLKCRGFTPIIKGSLYVIMDM